MHNYISAYTYTYIYIYIYTHVCVCKYKCLHVYVYVYVYVYIYIHTCIHKYAYTHRCVYIYIYVYVVHMCSDAYSFRLRTLLPLAVRKPSMVSVAAYRPRRSESASISVRPDACRSYIRASLSTHLHQAAHVMC